MGNRRLSEVEGVSKIQADRVNHDSMSEDE